MKIINIPQPMKIEVADMPRPELKDGYAVVKIEYCGICGGDPNAFKGGNPTVRYPIVGLGHEGVGYIEEIGENDRGLKVGDKVTLEPYIPCHHCPQCAKGHFNNCEHIHVCGVHTTGMMCEHFRHPLELIHKVADDLPLQEAVLVEPFTIGLHAATRVGVEKGDVCLVFGAGVIGLMSAFAIRHYGAEPVIVDVVQERLDAAKEMGFAVCNSKTQDLQAYMQKRTDGHMADVIIECTGSPFVLKDLHLYCAYGARVALVGWPKKPVELNTIKCMQREVTIYTSRNSNRKFPEAIELIQNHFLPAEKIVTNVIRPEQVEETMNDILEHPQNYLKVIVDFS